MQPFRMSALELLSAYRTRTLSPVEAMASVIARVEAYEPHIHATWLYAPERALKEARASEARWAKGEPIGPLDGVPVTVKDNIATRGDPKPVGTAAEDMTPATGGRAARGAAARSGRDHLRQDDHARLRHAVVGPLELPRARAQSVEARPQSRRLVGGSGARRRRALWPAPSRHRHRRLGAAARRLVRPGRAQAERRPDSDRSALHRPRRRPDDPRCGRRRLDDGDARAA